MIFSELYGSIYMPAYHRETKSNINSFFATN